MRANALLFSILFLFIALAGELYPAFDSALLWGTLEYDVATFALFVLIEQAIILYWLRCWIARFYAFDGATLTVTDGVLFRKKIVIPLERINVVTQCQDWIGRFFHYSTITVSLINQPNAVTMPHMTNPEQG
ncbi:hypothetical protein A2880_02145 [Candidatus Peribacteria bacterium RIFCSPHIGHO2_01_FULL_49_38]|nr:MAG: hypothetical protein A2880_02145 [Candidatus Peribacteria bacterium RIFCSPHIGHO2_01_FULL_49_38]